METFYITLPSTASANLYSNTQSHFRVQLPSALSLKGNWQVGLSEIHMPTAFNNLDESTNKFRVRHSNPTGVHNLSFKIPKFSFTGKGASPYFDMVKHVFGRLPPDLAKSLNFALNDMDESVFGGLELPSGYSVNFSPPLKRLFGIDENGVFQNVPTPKDTYTLAHSGRDLTLSISFPASKENPSTDVHDLAISPGLYTHVDHVTQSMIDVIPVGIKNEISFRLNRDGTLTIHCNEGVTLEFPKRAHGLGSLLGFADEQILLQGVSTGKYTVDLKRGVHGLYVYTDIITPHIVGDTIAPLLRVIPVENEERYNYVKTYSSPDFYNLLNHHIETIRIDIRTDSGSRPIFRHGKTLIKLLFRKV